MSANGPIRARCDAQDRLVSADAPLAALHARCGGQGEGLLAIPALLTLVRKARRAGQSLARAILAWDDGQEVSAWANVVPDDDGCALELTQWRVVPANLPEQKAPPEGLLRQLAEGHLLLDSEQRILAVDLRAPDLACLGEVLADGFGRCWTDFVTLEGQGHHRQPLHWRLLDDAPFAVAGSDRRWRARILPRVRAGFELLLLPETIARLPGRPVEPVGSVVGGAAVAGAPGWNGLLGRDLAPALRQPISRIIANAETIRTRLAGPLSDDYAGYAADIAEAGRHLMGLVEDLADLDAVEAADFNPASDQIDLADCARRAAGILSVRAQERRIVLATPPSDLRVPAVGEFRRVLQVLLNLLTNAIRYTPSDTVVSLGCGTDGVHAWISVMDQGQGLTPEQASRVFEKFERLGRHGDGGSGLGLYISRRLARAMGGDLVVESTPGEGACFVMTLPADVAAVRAING